MGTKIGVTLALDGERQYKQAITSINAEQKNLTSQMKLVTSEFKGNANSMEALTKKGEILKSQYASTESKIKTLEAAVTSSSKRQEEAAQKVEKLKKALEQAKTEMSAMEESTDGSSEELDKQKQVVSDLEKELSKATSAYLSADKSTEDWETKLNSAKAELNDLDGELQQNDRYLKEAESSTDKTASSIDEYGSEIKEAKEETSTFGSVLKANLASEAIISGIKAVGRAAKDAAKGVVEISKASAAYADDVLTISNNTGLATDTIQELMYAQDLMDVSLDTVTSTMAKNIKSMSNASQGSARYAEAYKALGIEVTDTNGQLRDSETVFWQAIDALGNMTNETRRDAIAMQLFGRSAQDLNSLIKIGSSGFNELASEANKTGYVLKNDTLSSLGKTQDGFDRLSLSVTTAKNVFGAKLATEMTRASKDIGESLVKLADKAGDLAADVLPAVVDGFEWLVDNGDTIVKTAAGIGAGFASLKIANVVSGAVEQIKNLKTVTEGAAKSQGILNTVVSANPYVLMASVLVGVITAVTLFGDSSDRASEQVKKLAESNEAAVKSANAVVESADEMTSSYKDNIAQIEAEQQYAKNLTDQLYDLADKENKSAGEKQYMAQMVSELNDLVPNLNLSLNEQTGEYNLQKDAVFELIDANAAYIKAQATQEYATEIIKKQTEAEIERIKLVEEANKLDDERTKVLNDYNDSMVEMQKTATDYTILNGELSAAESQRDTDLKAIDEQIKTNEESQNALNDSMEDMQLEAEAVSKYLKGEGGDALDEYAAGSGEAAAAAQEAAQQIADAYEEMKGSLSQTLESQMNMFEKFSGGMEITKEELLTNMASQIDGVRDWSNNLQELGDRGVNQGLLQYLSELGPQGANYVAEFAKMSDSELQEASAMWAESMDLKDTVSVTVADMLTGYSESLQAGAQGVADTAKDEGENIGGSLNTGLMNGMLGTEDFATEAIKQVSEDVTDTSKKTFGTNSPSKVFTQIGQYLMQGLQLGIRQGSMAAKGIMRTVTQQIVTQSGTGLNKAQFVTAGRNVTAGITEGIQSRGSSAVNAVSNITANVKSHASVGMSQSIYYSIGRNVTAGMESGIVSGRSGVINAVARVCADAENTARSRLRIHSPSEVFEELGAYSAEGFGIGYEKEMTGVNDMIAESVSIPEVGTIGGTIRAGEETESVMEMLKTYLPYLPYLADMAKTYGKVFLDPREASREMAPYMNKDLKTLGR